MHALGLLHKLFKKSAIGIHKNRLEALFIAVESLLYGRLLTLTGLGRSMQSQAQVKNNIKRIDRLLGNNLLHKEVMPLYKELAQHVLQGIKQPIVLIDWSQLDDNDTHYIMTAALPYGLNK